MSFEITLLDLQDAPTFERVLQLHGAAFGVAADDLRQHLRHSSLDAPPGSIFLGGFVDDRLATTTFLLRHKIYVRGAPDFALQICNSATHPEFHSRGLFSELIRYAQTSTDVLFLCGFPNPKAAPIYSGKLGFSTVPLVNVVAPFAFASGLFLRIASAAETAIVFDQKELLAWKLRCGRNPSVVASEGVMAWGYEKRRRGVPLQLFKVAGAGSNGEAIGGPGMLYSIPGIGTPAFRRVLGNSAFTRPTSGEFIIYFRRPCDTLDMIAFQGLADFA